MKNAPPVRNCSLRALNGPGSGRLDTDKYQVLTFESRIADPWFDRKLTGSQIGPNRISGRLLVDLAAL